MLPLIEKAQVLRGKKENLCAEAAQGYGESKLLSGNSGKREKRSSHSCALTPLTVRVITTLDGVALRWKTH